MIMLRFSSADSTVNLSKLLAKVNYRIFVIAVFFQDCSTSINCACQTTKLWKWKYLQSEKKKYTPLLHKKIS